MIIQYEVEPGSGKWQDIETSRKIRGLEDARKYGEKNNMLGGFRLIGVKGYMQLDSEVVQKPVVKGVTIKATAVQQDKIKPAPEPEGSETE